MSDLGQAHPKILYLIGSLRCGGQERQLYYLLRELDRTRYPVALAVWNLATDDFYEAEIRALGVPVLPLETPSRIGKLNRLTRLVKQLRPEVIHSYSFYTNVAAYWGGIGLPAIPVGSLRISFKQSLADNGIVGYLSARWPRKHISNSYAACREVQACRSFFRPREVYVVPNGVDLEAFSPAPFPTGKAPQMLAVGSLLPLKRWDVLLEAVAHLKKGGVRGELKVAGDGPEQERLKELAGNLGIKDRVQWLGRSSDLPSLLGQSYFLVHSSDSEGMPNVVSEAMACGRAVVATDAGDTSLMVEEGKTGFVVPRRDFLALAERMKQLITNPGLCAAMGTAARRRAEKCFSLPLLAERTLAAYCQAGWRPN